MMTEKKTSRIDRAKELDAEAKRLRREEERFRSEVLERKDEVLKWLGVGQTSERLSDTQWTEVAEIYGISETELLEYITSERQVNYFKSYRKPAYETENAFNSSL